MVKALPELGHLELSASQLRKLSGAYLKALSAAAAVKYVNGESSISQWQVHRTTGQPPVATWLTVRRLRYLQRVLAHAPAPLLWLLDTDRKWISLVIADLALLKGALRQLEELPPPKTIYVHGYLLSRRTQGHGAKS